MLLSKMTARARTECNSDDPRHSIGLTRGRGAGTSRHGAISDERDVYDPRSSHTVIPASSPSLAPTGSRRNRKLLRS